MDQLGENLTRIRGESDNNMTRIRRESDQSNAHRLQISISGIPRTHHKEQLQNANISGIYIFTQVQEYCQEIFKKMTFHLPPIILVRA